MPNFKYNPLNSEFDIVSGGASSSSSSRIQDADNDTFVEVEQSPDEDIVRITTGGTPRAYISDILLRLGGISSGIEHYIDISGASANDEIAIGRNGAGVFRFRIDGTTEYTGNTAAEAALGSNTVMYRTQDGTLKLTSDSLDYSYRNKNSIIIAASDETSTITTGTSKVTFRMPYAFELIEVRASLTTAGTGTTTIDVNAGGASIFSTLLTIDSTETTSTTAATPAVISTTSLTDDQEITIDFDTVGTSATGVKVTLIGYDT